MILDALSLITCFRPGLNTAMVRRAVVFSREAHEGQWRENGDPAFVHPTNVARRLALSGADEITTVAGILHDTVEDSDVTLADLRTNFGGTLAEIVSLLTKPCMGVPPDVMALATRASWQPPLFRAFCVKIADRIDNMSTVRVLPKWRQTKLALESLRILCPAAERFDPTAAAVLRRLSQTTLHA